MTRTTRPSPETSPDLLGHGPAVLRVHVSLGRAALPARWLRPVPGRVGMSLAASLDQGHVLLQGPLVTCAALRASLWGQRRSVGLWVQRCITSSSRLQEALGAGWGIDALEDPGLTVPPAPGRGLEATRQREIFVYSRRGDRILNSRVTVQGAGRISVGGSSPGAGLALCRLGYRDAAVHIRAPGREYDL